MHWHARINIDYLRLFERNRSEDSPKLRVNGTVQTNNLCSVLPAVLPIKLKLHLSQLLEFTAKPRLWDVGENLAQGCIDYYAECDLCWNNNFHIEVVIEEHTIVLSKAARSQNAAWT